MATEYLANLLKSYCYLFTCVSCHEAEADESVVRCNSWRDNGIDKDALVEQFSSDEEREVVVANEKWNDWSFGMSNFTSHFTEALKSKVGVLPQAFLTLWLGNHDVESCAYSGS